MARSQAKKAAPGLRQRAVRWCFRPRALLVASTVALVWVLIPRLCERLPQADQRPEYLVGREHILLTPPPHWIPPELPADALRRAGLDGRLSLLDSSLSERIAAAFFTHPWIQDVHRVAKSFPARVQVDVTYREPVAIVRGVDGYYPIDCHACLLPGHDFRPSDIDRYPVIENINSIPVSGQGHSWGDPCVDGAARLAAVLRVIPEDTQHSLWQTLDLAAIIAPGHLYLPGESADPEFAIRTTGGSEILWGRAPGTRHPGELSVDKKIGRLLDYHRDHGSLDDAPDPYTIDIRQWDRIIRTRLAASSRLRR